jgi:hypothetical protein
MISIRYANPRVRLLTWGVLSAACEAPCALPREMNKSRIRPVRAREAVRPILRSSLTVATSGMMLQAKPRSRQAAVGNPIVTL